MKIRSRRINKDSAITLPFKPESKSYAYRISSNIRRGRLLTFEQAWCGVYWREVCKRERRLFWIQAIKFDKHAVGVYQHRNNLLVGHILNELSRQTHYFFEPDKGYFLEL